ncbi:MAG: CoB--CoM heterodisulfide reductase iron-sulfur subunit B family protein [Nitrospinae bacterium]|nr:CoB--CoM heterodisulfide reductase iron-sulfur subunit B family protein [Nitrospinota bacterium]
MRYALFTGCVAKGAGRELMNATIFSADRLGIQLNEMKDASCCGAGVMDDDNHFLADTLNARTFSLAEEQGLDIMTICGTCQGVMRTAQTKMDNNPKYKEKVNAQLKADTGRVYAGKVKVKHFYQIVNDEYGLDNLKLRVTRKLSGLKVAPFYGCYVLRPHESSDVKVADKPDYLEKLISAVGGTAVDYPEKQKCCGFPILMANKSNSLQLSGNAIVGAIKAGADCIVTPCPLCHLNMDSYQPEIEGMIGEKLNLPILHYPQLLALALGASLDDIKANTHIVRPNNALKEITA